MVSTRRWMTEYKCDDCGSMLFFTRLGNYWCLKCCEIRNYPELPDRLRALIPRGRKT